MFILWNNDDTLADPGGCTQTNHQPFEIKKKIEKNVMKQIEKKKKRKNYNTYVFVWFLSSYTFISQFFQNSTHPHPSFSLIHCDQFYFWISLCYDPMRKKNKNSITIYVLSLVLFENKTSMEVPVEIQ